VRTDSLRFLTTEWAAAALAARGWRNAPRSSWSRRAFRATAAVSTSGLTPTRSCCRCEQVSCFRAVQIAVRSVPRHLLNACLYVCVVSLVWLFLAVPCPLLCLFLFNSKLLGSFVLLGSLAFKVPQILKLKKNKSADGVTVPIFVSMHFHIIPCIYRPLHSADSGGVCRDDASSMHLCFQGYFFLTFFANKQIEQFALEFCVSAMSISFNYHIQAPFRLHTRTHIRTHTH